MVSVENYNISLPSRIENICLTEKLIDEICCTNHISEKIYGNILIAITEAVANGIIHGNKSNPNKKIEIKSKIKNNALLFFIKDQGAGFDYGNLPDPTDPQNIESANGRGIFLMKHLCDRICFKDNGSKVILEFILDSRT